MHTVLKFEKELKMYLLHVDIYCHIVPYPKLDEVRHVSFVERSAEKVLRTFLLAQASSVSDCCLFSGWKEFVPSSIDVQNQ